MRFDRVFVLDWSAASSPSPARPSANAIWLAEASANGTSSSYYRTRTALLDALGARIADRLAAGETVLLGADFPFGYPQGFARALTDSDAGLALWDWLTRHIEDGPDNANNRFALAAAVNARFAGIGPFWGRPASLDLPGLPEKGSARQGTGLPERRLVETFVPRAQSVWKLFTTGSVGSQALLGIPAMARLRARFGTACAAWPFEPLTGARLVLAEVYPSLLDPEVRRHLTPDAIKDEVQVRVLADALFDLASRDALAPLLAPDAPDSVLACEGWILGVGAEDALRSAAGRSRP